MNNILAFILGGVFVILFLVIFMAMFSPKDTFSALHLCGHQITEYRE